MENKVSSIFIDNVFVFHALYESVYTHKAHSCFQVHTHMQRSIKALFSLGVILGTCNAAEMHKKEEKIADHAAFIVFSAPIVLDNLVFLSHLQGISEATLRKTVREVADESTKKLKQVIKKENAEFAEEIDTYLRDLSKEYNRYLPKRNKLFEKDLSTQTADAQKVQVTKTREKIQSYTPSTYSQLRKYIIKLLDTKEQEKKDLWHKYTSIVTRAIKAMQRQEAVTSAMDAAKRDFSVEIKRILLNSEVNIKSFYLERARLNLGGAIYTPGLLIQILSKIDTEDRDAFAKKLVSSLLQPVLLLKTKLSSLIPEEAKAEVIKFVQASIGTTHVYSLKEMVDSAYNLRSDSICRITKRNPKKKEIIQRIDKIQTENSSRMLETFQSAPAALFRDFIILDTHLAEIYTELAVQGGTDERKKNMLSKVFDIN